jgi:hypothetical protein
MNDARHAVSDGAVIINPSAVEQGMSSVQKETWQFQSDKKLAPATKEPLKGDIEFGQDLYEKKPATMARPVDADKSTKVLNFEDGTVSNDKSAKILKFEKCPTTHTQMMDKLEAAKIAEAKMSKIAGMHDKIEHKDLSISKGEMIHKKLGEKTANIKPMSDEDIIALKKKLSILFKENPDAVKKYPEGSIGKIPKTGEPANDKQTSQQPPAKDMAEVERQNKLDREKFQNSMTPEQLKKLEALKQH